MHFIDKIKKFNKALPVILIILEIVAMLFFIVTFILCWVAQFEDKTTAGYIITIISAAVGGVAAVLGAVCSVLLGRVFTKKMQKDDNKPEIYIPSNFDLAWAIKVNLNPTEPKENNDSDYPLDYNIFLKNSDKCPFVIEKMDADGSSFCPSPVSYVEKNALFNLSFCSSREHREIELSIKSADGYHYRLECKLDEEREPIFVSLKEETCK